MVVGSQPPEVAARAVGVKWNRIRAYRNHMTRVTRMPTQRGARRFKGEAS
jgi:hypothetical protein